MLILSLLITILVGSGLSQTAKVVQLDAADANHALDLYKAKAAIEKQITDLESQIRSKYLFEGIGCQYLAAPGEHLKDCKAPLSGWDYGFEFSTDFKFIVPKISPNNCLSGNSWGTYITSPCNSINFMNTPVILSESK